MKTIIKKGLKRGFIFLFIALFMSSCVIDKKILLFQEKTIKDTSSEIVGQLGQPYRLKPGDHVYIKIYSIDPKTSKFFQTDFPQFMSSTYLYLNSYKVDEEGYLSFSFVEKMYVKGLTINEVQDLIQNTLDQYFKESTVFVKLVNFQVTILGEVSNPGNYKVEKEELSMYEALGMAGGFTDFSNVREVKLVRQTPNGSRIYTIDLTDNAFLQSPFLHLQPNDIIYVDPRKSKRFAFTKFPYGFAFGIAGTLLGIYNLIDENFLK